MAGTSDSENLVERLQGELEPQDGRWRARHDGHLLSSHFQPVYSLPHRRAIGVEALLRIERPDGTPMLPLSFFGQIGGIDNLLHIDRLARLLHARNYTAQPQYQDGWLFLNIHPAVFLHGALQVELLAEAVSSIGSLGLPAHRLVFEVSEAAMAQDDEFEAAVARARATGCLLALDDFGAGHSNFDRVLRVHPEIVKLDRSLLRRAMNSASVARVMTQMVSLLHECGAMVLLEGVETDDEALLALDADVDLVQGFAFGRPDPDVPRGHSVSQAIEQVWKCYDERHGSSRVQHAQRLAPFAAALKKALPGLRQGQGLRMAASALLALPEVQLCYLLDDQGCEMGPPVGPSRPYAPSADRRFEPLERAGHARWARRPYFRRAVAELGQVQMTRPYLSMHGARMCVTVSLAFWCQARMQVLCADLDWSGVEV